MHRRKRLTEWQYALGILTGLLLVLAPFLVARGLRLDWQGPAAAPTKPGASGMPASDSVNLLVLGVDERAEDKGRSDTMLLVRFEPGGVRVISIPRDTLVSIDGHGEGKINSAFPYGGADLSRKAVSDLFGVPVPYYLKVNMEGFRQLVDLLGGIPFDVPKALHYVDPSDNLVIDLKPGPQLLDGEKAEQFVRFRYDAIGDDMGRVARQQAFLKAAMAHALTPANLPKLPALLYQGRQYVTTNLPVTLGLQLAQSLYQAGRTGAVALETLPGRGADQDGISYFLVNSTELNRMVSSWQ